MKLDKADMFMCSVKVSRPQEQDAAHIHFLKEQFTQKWKFAQKVLTLRPSKM